MSGRFESSPLARRNFVKLLGAAAGVTVAATLADKTPVAGAMGNTSDQERPIRLSAVSGLQKVGMVNPMIGTGWHGHMFPGATAPFGLVQLSPDTAGISEPLWNKRWDIYHWDHCSGYHYPDDTILGFTHTHLQGTGAKDLGDVLLMPVVQDANWGWNAGRPSGEHEAQITYLGHNTGWVSRDGDHAYASRFSHDHEKASPGYYAVDLITPGVHAELTATTRCGMHRYSYSNVPADKKRGVILDLVHGLGCTVYHAELNIESPTRITGKRFTHGWAPDRKVYFVIESSKPFTHLDVSVDGAVRKAAVGDRLSGVQMKAIFTHAADDDRLTIRVGISCTGIKGARRNLAAEIPHWDFDSVRHSTEKKWEKALGAITAELPSRELSETFYTAAYHGMVAPATFNDVDGAYRGEDRRNHPNPGFTNYTTLSIWDIYRGEFPYMMFTQPNRINDVINTLLVDYQQLNENSLPVWPLWGNETWCMTGFHVVGMIAAAYVRGYRGYDVEKVYAAMRTTALVGATANNNKALQAQFRSLGYVASTPGQQSVSRTLDFCYDYWCVGAMAQMLGKYDDAKRFYKLSQNYKNLFDPSTGFMRGKLADGSWRKPFEPDREYWADYTESDAWQATFNVMQDVQGLIDLYGSDEAFIAKLDAFFTAPSRVFSSSPDISGMVGQDAQGNEPSNHIPYLYPFAGAPWKTQYWVRRVAALYNNTPDGIPGNDDCGQLSSWFALTALGFYPVNAVNGVYILGSPLVRRAVMRDPAGGGTFSIIAENNRPENCYIKRAKLNGKILDRAWITHGEILAGGELELDMSAKPEKDWGRDRKVRPPSSLLV